MLEQKHSLVYCIGYNLVGKKNRKLLREREKKNNEVGGYRKGFGDKKRKIIIINHLSISFHTDIVSGLTASNCLCPISSGNILLFKDESRRRSVNKES